MEGKGRRGQGEADPSLELEGNKTGGDKKLGELKNHPLGSPSARWKMGLHLACSTWEDKEEVRAGQVD